MAEWATYIIVAPDDRRTVARLPEALCRNGAAAAPAWLVRQMGFDASPAKGWRLCPLPPGLSAPARAGDRTSSPRLLLARPTVAGASRRPSDPRQARLKREWDLLQELNAESDCVYVEPLNELAGSEPEHFRVTFACRGIVGVDPSTQAPIYGERHQVELLCDDDFPSKPPRLRWITPIWHPNIQHDREKAVCINEAEWLGAMKIYDLCRMMFEMVQYKNYHAESNTPPYPLDGVVAAWVRNHAEPRGIVKKGERFVDDKPFTRGDADPNRSAPAMLAAPPHIRILSRSSAAEMGADDATRPRARILIPARPSESNAGALMAPVHVNVLNESAEVRASRIKITKRE